MFFRFVFSKWRHLKKLLFTPSKYEVAELLFWCTVLPASSVSQTVLHFGDRVSREEGARIAVLLSLFRGALEAWKIVLCTLCLLGLRVTVLGTYCFFFSSVLTLRTEFWDPTFCICGGFKFQLCFLSCNMHMNHLEILLKYRFCFCRCSLRNYLDAVIRS